MMEISNQLKGLLESVERRIEFLNIEMKAEKDAVPVLKSKDKT